MEINYFVAQTALIGLNLIFTVAGFGLIIHILTKKD